MGSPHTAIRRAAPHRRSVFVSRTADHAEYLRYLPNTDHSLKGSYRDAAESALAFYQSILTNTPRPRFAWDFEQDGSIRVKTETRPNIVTLWQAHHPDARDFRLETIGRAFTSSILTVRATASMLAQCRRRRRAGQPTSSR